jgi:hypothetical protein
MVARLEEYFEELFQRRWFEWLLIASVIYAAVWLYLLPRTVVFDLALCYAIGLWLGMFNVVVLRVLLAIGRGLREHFLSWDGEDRRMRERPRA